jgi:hypothetical protein
MNTGVQEAVCAFARHIIALRTGEAIEVIERPEMVHRDKPAVEELWASSSREYAVEHTRLESFDGQIGNEARLDRLMGPVRAQLTGRLPGTYVLALPAGVTWGGRHAQVGHEIVRLTLEQAPRMQDGQTVALRSEGLPLNVQLHRRNGHGSRIVVQSIVEGEAEELRLTRVHRAFQAKCPKLAAWSGEGRVSLLVLEANDIQRSNIFVVWEAVDQVIAARPDIPDLIVFVETDGSPMFGWVLKDGPHTGDDVPRPNGSRCYIGGPLHAAPMDP